MKTLLKRGESKHPFLCKKDFLFW